jgi:hypothetical protein
VRLFFLHIVLILLAIQSNAQTILWEKHWTKGNDETAEIIKINKDSTFIISGAWSAGGYYPCFFLNIDKSGNILWDTLGRNLVTGEQDIVERPEGGYIFTASGFDYSYMSIFIQKIKFDGDTLPSMSYPNDYLSIFPNKILMLQGKEEYLIAGTVYCTDFNSYFFLQKIDSSGNVIWCKKYAQALGTYQVDLIVNKKGNLVLSGVSEKGTSGFIPHPYFVEVTPDGDSLQSKNVIIRDANDVEEHYHMYNNLIQTSDGGYAFSGYIDSSASPMDIQVGFIAKVDSAFNLQWTYFHRTLTLSQGVHTTKVRELKDSSIVLLGNDDAGSNFFVLRVNKDGQFMSRKLFTSAIASSVWMYDWAFLNDGSAVVIGRGSGGAYLARIGNVGQPFIEQDSCKSFAATFTAEQIGDSIRFTNTSNGGYAWADSSIWKFSDSTGSTLFSKKILVSGAPDSVWARLTAINPYGCTNTVAKKVKVMRDCSGAPVPSFTANENSDSVFFVNTSTGNIIISYQWKFSDSTASVLTNPKLKINAPLDSVWARLTVTDNDGCYTTLSQKVKVSTLTAINQKTSSLSVSVSPNPFTETTIFKVNNNSNSGYQLTILNSLGEEIFSRNFSEKEYTLNASSFSSGLYMYVVRDAEGKMKSGKLVVE